MTPRPLVVIGDVLLDRDVDGAVERLSPDGPAPVVDESGVESRPGGAGLAAALSAADGRDVTLITALSEDHSGDELREMLDARGVTVVDIGLSAPTPEKVRVRASGRTLLRLDRGGGTVADVGAAGAAARAAVGWASAVLVADYGRGVAADAALRSALVSLPDDVPVVWDPHPRGPEPVRGATLATPNASEAKLFAPHVEGSAVPSVAERATALAERWKARGVCVTRGADGALLARPGADPFVVGTPLTVESDPCGAGDRFASRCAQALADGAGMEQALVDAVASASSFVATGGVAASGGSTPPAEQPGETAWEIVERVRAAGGTVVATGGCFDLIHSGHVQTLEAARALGDCLVVCLNSDASVRALKGAARPVVCERDRAAVLGALGCVDAVAVFGDPTPEPILAKLRPDVWVKGGDYTAEQLPEADLLRSWGGRAVLVPYLAGHSTSRLIEEAMLSDAV